jgi:hypothetical protein
VVTSAEASQRAVTHAPQVEIPTVVAGKGGLQAMGEGGLQVVLDTAARADAKSMDPNTARMLPKAVAAMWEMHRVRETHLSTAAQVPGYCEKPVIQNRSSHACLIIKILA